MRTEVIVEICDERLRHVSARKPTMSPGEPCQVPTTEMPHAPHRQQVKAAFSRGEYSECLL
jgi:hypothetical protein